MVSSKKILLALPLTPSVRPAGKWRLAATCQQSEAAALSPLAGGQEQFTAAFVCRGKKEERGKCRAQRLCLGFQKDMGAKIFIPVR